VPSSLSLSSPLRRSLIVLAGLLFEEALEDAVRGLGPEELTGAGGLLSQLAGRVVQAALEAEMDRPFGPPAGRCPGRV